MFHTATLFAIDSSFIRRGAVGGRIVQAFGRKVETGEQICHYIVSKVATLKEPRFPRKRVCGEGRREALQWVARTILFRLLTILTTDKHTSISKLT